MKIDRNPAILNVKKHGAIDVICPECNIRTLDEFSVDALRMKCGNCGYVWRVNYKGCPSTYSI